MTSLPITVIGVILVVLNFSTITLQSGGQQKRLFMSSNSSKSQFFSRRIVNVCENSCDYSLPSEAVTHAEDYDLILVRAGTYADCIVIPPNLAHMWIRGIGGMAHMKGVVCEHKAAFVVTAGQIVIENFEFSDLYIPCELGQNASGIRLESGDLLVTNSYFHDSQGGILTANTGSSNVTISNSHFARLGEHITHCARNPFPWFHNIYIGVEASLTLNNSIVEDNPTGHLVKSRAHRSTLKCNRITNGFHELYKKNGFLIDFPQGGDNLIEKNIIVQGPLSDGQHIMVAYGSEIQPQRFTIEPNPVQQFAMSGNILINDSKRGTFVQMFSVTPEPAKLSGNVFLGPGTRVGGYSSSVIETEGLPDNSSSNGSPPTPSECSSKIGTTMDY